MTLAALRLTTITDFLVQHVLTYVMIWDSASHGDGLLAGDSLCHKMLKLQCQPFYCVNISSIVSLLLVNLHKSNPVKKILLNLRWGSEDYKCKGPDTCTLKLPNILCPSLKGNVNLKTSLKIFDVCIVLHYSVEFFLFSFYIANLLLTTIFLVFSCWISHQRPFLVDRNTNKRKSLLSDNSSSKA